MREPQAAIPRFFLYGEPPRDVKIVKLPPRRPRYKQVLADGERLRQAFAQRLEKREKEE